MTKNRDVKIPIFFIDNISFIVYNSHINRNTGGIENEIYETL